MESYWNEVVVVKKENRHELSLQGSEISSRISKSGLCPGIFTLTGLNHLEISSTCLSNVNVGNLGNLVNLSSLILCSNKIEKMPKSLGKLTKLKVLDLSNNELISLPEEISTLISLEVFNINKNLLEEIPSVCGLVKLHKLNLSHNKLKSLPQGISDKKLVHLSHIWASNNEIVEIPDDLLNLPHLNVLDLAENKIKDVPPELSLCLRLKELNLKGNVVPDRKLSKLLEQSSKKSIFEFLSNVLDKKQKSEGSSRGGGGGGKKNKKKSRFQTKGEGDEVCEEEKLVKNQINVLRFPEENGVSIVVSRAVLNVRPFIVCCFVKNLNFNRNTTAFKKFIALQTKLHDTICEKRQVATIATHDLNLVKYPLSYDAKVPSQIKIIPLFAKEEVTAQTLVANLRKEADEIRKEKKRNKLSGIHKYLDLLHEKPEYPCLVDKDGHVISFPPITNSDKTKISKESSSVLIEITSSRSLNICKEVMDVLLLEMLNLGIGEILPGQNGTESLNEEEEEGNVKYKLTIQQVNVLNEDHSLRVVYPSRTDLQNSDLINVTYYDMKD